VKLSEVIKKLSLDVKTVNVGLEKDVTGVYVSDLLSDVMANSKEGHIWVTLQTHLNIVAVAGLKTMAGIIIVNNRQPEKEIIKKAESEKIAIMTTSLPAFEVAGKLYQMLS
jgi:hypothetical protein